MDCADGIQECLETLRDLKANNAQARYMEELDRKIDAVEHQTGLQRWEMQCLMVLPVWF